MKTRVKSLCAVGVCWTLAAAVAAQDTLQLRYLPSKDELAYRKTQKMKQVQKVMDKELTNHVTSTELSTWKIAEAKGNLEVKTETKSLLIKMKFTGLGDYEFDSSKNDNEKGSALGSALTPLYERMSGANLTYTMTPLGKLTKIEGYKELIGDLAKENPLVAQFAAGGSEDAALLGATEYFPMLTADAVNPGHRWETPFEVNMDKFGKVKGKKTYVYEGPSKVGKHKTAKISCTVDLAFDLNIDMGAAKVTGNMSISESKGTLHFDPANGRLVSMSNEYKLSGNLNVSAGGQDIPVGVEQVQQVTMELLESLPK